MTLIIGTRVGIWSDRRITASSGELYDPIRKVARNRHLVAGFAGDYSHVLAALDAVRDGADSPDAFVTLKVDGIVVHQGVLYLVDHKRTWVCTEPFVTIGSGCTEAKAFLIGRRSCSDRAVRAAHAYVASVRTDCGDGVNLVRALRI